MPVRSAVIAASGNVSGGSAPAIYVCPQLRVALVKSVALSVITGTAATATLLVRRKGVNYRVASHTGDVGSGTTVTGLSIVLEWGDELLVQSNGSSVVRAHVSGALLVVPVAAAEVGPTN